MIYRRRFFSSILLIGLILVAGWLWYVQLRKPEWKIVEVGTRIAGADLDFIRPEVRARLISEGFHISSRTLVIAPPEPGVLFSTVRKPGNQEQFTYLILFRYGRRLSSYGGIISRDRKLLCTFDGTVAETNDRFEVNGKPIEVSYRVELNEARTAVAKERLTIEGNYVDIRSGRVFLVDLTAEVPVYRQMKVELPATPARFETKQDAERAAEAIRQNLENQDSRIKAFCRRRSVRLLTNLERIIILSTSSGDEIVDPNDEQIRQALSTLDVGSDGLGWAILSRSEMTYLQASGDKKSRFKMEYQKGDIDNHFRAAREDFELEEVVRVFAEYRDRKIDWSAYGDWDRIKW
jgi:hypothetical protein